MEQLIFLITGKPLGRQIWIWLIPHALGCMGIVAGEYRLLMKGVISALLAAVLSGTSRALYSVAAPRMVITERDHRRLDTLFYCLGILISGIDRKSVV